MGWTGLKNGELLRAASAQFDVFVTVDRNLAYQQNFSSATIGIVVMAAKSNRLADLKPLLSKVLEVIESVRPGRLEIVGTESR